VSPKPPTSRTTPGIAKAPRTGARRDTSPPATGPGEKDVLLGFLDYLRSSITARVDGAPEPDVRAPGVPSGTNLLGLVHHLTQVERFIFLGVGVSDWPATFHSPDGATADDILTAYREATHEANEIIATCSDLAEPTRRPTTRGQAPSMRWALAHMIEETGRHAGHADILRELIDGQTGR
jgi:Protein of unknown function (DUF664)